MVNKLKLGDPILKLQRGEKQRDQLMTQLQEVLNNNLPRLEFKKNSQLEPSLNTHEYSLLFMIYQPLKKTSGCF